MSHISFSLHQQVMRLPLELGGILLLQRSRLLFQQKLRFHQGGRNRKLFYEQLAAYQCIKFPRYSNDEYSIYMQSWKCEFGKLVPKVIEPKVSAAELIIDRYYKVLITFPHS